MTFIQLSSIRIDGQTQSRAKLNNDIVTEYAEEFKKGTEFPPVTVFFDGKDNWLADGFHRYHAAKQAGDRDIVATIIHGTLRDAKFFSWKANNEHGQRRTNEDKRSIVLDILADHEAGQWSDNHIAKEFGFAQSFVSKLRSSLDSSQVTKTSLNSELSEDSEGRTYTTKHGTTATMKTGYIGQRLATAPTAQPEPAKPVNIEESEEIAEEYTELAQARDEIDELRCALALAHMPGDIPEDERLHAAELMKSLQAQVISLRALLAATESSRDFLTQQNNEMKSQLAAQRRQIEKLKV